MGPPQGERKRPLKTTTEPFVLRSRRLCGGVSKDVFRENRQSRRRGRVREEVPAHIDFDPCCSMILRRGAMRKVIYIAIILVPAALIILSSFPIPSLAARAGGVATGLAGSPSAALCSLTAGRGGEELARAGAPPFTQSGIDHPHASMPGHLVPLALAANRPSPTFEQWLGKWLRYLPKSANRGIGQLLRYLQWCAVRWMRWAGKASVFMLFALLTPLLDRALVRSWRTHGFRAFRISMALAVAVYVRLLLDRNTPMMGKGLLALAIVYGVAPNDLVPDYLLPAGFIDDVIAVMVSSRCFMGLCPDRLVERHALWATRRWSRAVRRHAAQRQTNA